MSASRKPNSNLKQHKNPSYMPPCRRETFSPAATSTSTSSSTSSSRFGTTRSPSSSSTISSSRYARAKSESFPSMRISQIKSLNSPLTELEVSISGGNARRSSEKFVPNREAEAYKSTGNAMHKACEFEDALNLYNKAIEISPRDAVLHSNKAASLMELKRFGDAVNACKEAIKLDPDYARPRHRLGYLYLSLGRVEEAREHLNFQVEKVDKEKLQNLQTMEDHLRKLTEARKFGQWGTVLTEVVAAIESGADSSPQLHVCRVEAYLNLEKLEEAELAFMDIKKLERGVLPLKTFGMASVAYQFFVSAKLQLALGEVGKADADLRSALLFDPRDVELLDFLSAFEEIVSARRKGSNLVKSRKFTEAASAFEEGLAVLPSLAFLYGCRADCWMKLGNWERMLKDCNRALTLHPGCIATRNQRAACYCKLKRWEDAIKDYEVCREKDPDNITTFKSLFEAQIAQRKLCGLNVKHLKFGGGVESVLSQAQFKDKISCPIYSVVFFMSSSNFQSMVMDEFFTELCDRYPTLNFLKVDVTKNQDCRAIARENGATVVPVYLFYKAGKMWDMLVTRTKVELEDSVKNFFSLGYSNLPAPPSS